ncbi:Hypothetical predicted protein [Octopus vulgaris]|uniref:Uncharacterized protein n=1 Tax=Octopus vulgaris TaxID=6645 RepID=A0AA36BR48_OCTVU|nr:Hypothetical predicted protein [Octopus vulgaris]
MLRPDFDYPNIDVASIRQQRGPSAEMGNMTNKESCSRNMCYTSNPNQDCCRGLANLAKTIHTNVTCYTASRT